MSSTVLAELKDGILLLTLNRPKKKNSFNVEQWKAFAAELDAARKMMTLRWSSSQVRAMIFRRART